MPRGQMPLRTRLIKVVHGGYQSDDCAFSYANGRSTVTRWRLRRDGAEKTGAHKEKNLAHAPSTSALGCLRTECGPQTEAFQCLRANISTSDRRLRQFDGRSPASDRRRRVSEGGTWVSDCGVVDCLRAECGPLIMGVDCPRVGRDTQTVAFECQRVERDSLTLEFECLRVKLEPRTVEFESLKGKRDLPTVEFDYLGVERNPLTVEHDCWRLTRPRARTTRNEEEKPQTAPRAAHRRWVSSLP